MTAKKRSAGPYVRTYASQLLNNSLDYNQTRCLFHMFFDSERKKIPSHAHEITFFTSAQQRLYISTVVYGKGYLTKLFYNDICTDNIHNMLADQSVSEILYCYHLSTYKPGEFFRVSFPQHQFVQQSTLPTHFYLSLQTEICRFRFYSVLIAQNAAVFFLQRISTTSS